MTTNDDDVVRCGTTGGWNTADDIWLIEGILFSNSASIGQHCSQQNMLTSNNVTPALDLRAVFI